MSSAQEAETGAGFFNAKQLLPLRLALEDLGHPQGPTPIQFDNKAATAIINETVSQKRSKAMDMRFYWLRDRVKQQHSMYTGDAAQKTTMTITQSTTHQVTIER